MLIRIGFGTDYDRHPIRYENPPVFEACYTYYIYDIEITKLQIIEIN